LRNRRTALRQLPAPKPDSRQHTTVFDRRLVQFLVGPRRFELLTSSMRTRILRFPTLHALAPDCELANVLAELERPDAMSCGETRASTRKHCSLFAHFSVATWSASRLWPVASHHASSTPTDIRTRSAPEARHYQTGGAGDAGSDIYAVTRRRRSVSATPATSSNSAAAPNDATSKPVSARVRDSAAAYDRYVTVPVSLTVT
jgi:hypothetical protein